MNFGRSRAKIRSVNVDFKVRGRGGLNRVQRPIKRFVKIIREPPKVFLTSESDSASPKTYKKIPHMT